jgi:hypothetical protein
MYALQIPATVSTAAIALERFEAAVYRYDAVFQAVVVPRVYHALIVAAHLFVQAAIATYVFGVRTGRWTRNWFAEYTAAPAIETTLIVEPQLQLAIAPSAATFLLPAETVFHPERAAAEERAMRQLCKTVMVNALPGSEVLITPAPKVKATRNRKPCNPKTTPEVARKAPTTAKVGKRTACID